jgi:DNA polymerase-3 subunit alpha
VTDFRVINGQRGKLALFKLDDKSGVIEARADEALINATATCSRTTSWSSSWASCSRTVSRAAAADRHQIWDLARRAAASASTCAWRSTAAPDIPRLLKDFPARAR